MKLGNSLKNSGHRASDYYYHKRLQLKQMQTGVRQVILSKQGNNYVRVPAPTVIEVGIEVLRLPGGSRHPSYVYGSQYEESGVVIALKGTGLGESNIGGIVAVVDWQGSGRIDEFPSNLLATKDLADWRERSGIKPPEPKYHIDQVLYVKPGISDRASSLYPAVGSHYETDLKIVEIVSSRFGSTILYRAYIPGNGFNWFNESQLITAKERDRLKHEDFKEYMFAIDSPPFLKRGERVKTYDGYLYNTDESVILKLTDELKSHLSWPIKQEDILNNEN